MKRILGLDSKGRVRFKNSKKNPIVVRQGLYYINDSPNMGIYDLHPDKDGCIGKVESTDVKTGEIRIRLN